MKFIPKNICVWRNPLHTCYGYIKGCTSEGDNHFQIRTHICRCDNKNWWFFFFFFEGGLNWRISQNITGLIPRWFLSILTMIQDSSMCLWSTEFNRSSTSSRQWKYMESEQNPADHSSHKLSVKEFVKSTWFTGQSFLWQKEVLKEEDVRVREINERDQEGTGLQRKRYLC